jgi:5-formyltetrahydrofolate cyclo-ligase
MSKQRIRNGMRKRIDTIPKAERIRQLEEVTKRIITLPEYAGASSLLIYLATAHEIDTVQLITQAWKDNKSVLVPVWEPGTANNMRAVRIFPETKFEIDDNRYKQPIRATPWTATIDLAIIPGLAFTVTGKRIGQGTGHFDRFLATQQVRHAIGVCFVQQLVDDLPTEPHDITMHRVITAFT